MKRFSILVSDTTLISDNPLRLGRTYYKMTVREKINTTVGKIEKNKAQYSLDKTNCLDFGLIISKYW